MDYSHPLNQTQLKAMVDVIHLLRNSVPLSIEQHEKLDTIFLSQMDEGEKKSVLHAWGYLMSFTENRPYISLKPKDFFHLQNLLSLHHDHKPFLAKYEDFSDYTELVQAIDNFNIIAKQNMTWSNEEKWVFDHLVNGWQLMTELWHLMMGVVAYRTRVLMCKLIFAFICVPIFNVPIPLYVTDDQWYYGIPLYATINSAYVCANNLKEIITSSCMKDKKVSNSSSSVPNITHLGQLYLILAKPNEEKTD